jgi:hypothetical protein
VKATKAIAQKFYTLSVLCLLLFLMFTGNSWAQIPADTKITPIVEKLIDNNARVRLEAHDALVSIGSGAVPTLVENLKNPDCNHSLACGLGFG